MQTKERILDAAESLFADHGFDATSLRRITSQAGVNLAAVNYHFGSKDALIAAVFQRILAPINRERLERLDELERLAAGPGTPAIVEAFIGPALRRSKGARSGPGVAMRLLGHALSQPDDRTRALFADIFRPVVARFTAALQRALPGHGDVEIFWRFFFMVGAMAHTMALSAHLPTLSGGLCEVKDPEAVVQRMVTFLAAGMETPTVSAAPAEPS
jgi:AcrR family transcriptional regulator